MPVFGSTRTARPVCTNTAGEALSSRLAGASEIPSASQFPSRSRAAPRRRQPSSGPKSASSKIASDRSSGRSAACKSGRSSDPTISDANVQRLPAGVCSSTSRPLSSSMLSRLHSSDSRPRAQLVRVNVGDAGAAFAPCRATLQNASLCVTSRTLPCRRSAASCRRSSPSRSIRLAELVELARPHVSAPSQQPPFRASECT